jgi:hypothetical protein
MKNIIILSTGLLLASCAAFGPKPKSVYHRAELNRPVEKIIVFPVTNFNGVQDATAKRVEATLNGKWAELYGKENIIPGGPVIFKLIESTGKDSYLKLIKSLDNVSMVEQITKDPKMKEFLGKITEKLGNYHLSLAIVSGDEKSYDAKNPVNVNIGFFDTKAMTWKWITKIEDKKGFVGKFDASAMMMVNNSFDLITTLEKKKK